MENLFALTNREPTLSIDSNGLALEYLEWLRRQQKGDGWKGYSFKKKKRNRLKNKMARMSRRRNRAS
jgi:hypothetical protein